MVVVVAVMLEVVLEVLLCLVVVLVVVAVVVGGGWEVGGGEGWDRRRCRCLWGRFG